MSLQQKLSAIRDAIQIDVGNRGLGRDPAANLFNACPDDFARACHSLAEHSAPVLGVITGFFIPSAGLGETDGPLGAVYLARTLPLLGIRVLLASDPFCRQALEAGLAKCGRLAETPVLDLPQSVRINPSPQPPPRSGEGEHDKSTATPGKPFGLPSPPLRFGEGVGGRGAFSAPQPWEQAGVSLPTHVLAVERVGPSHTPESIRAQPGADETTVQRFLGEVSPDHHDRCHTMRGVDVTELMRAASRVFERANPPVTIGIGDGGNEIGMGKIPWDVIRRNIPGGAVIACRVATDHLLVAGVSNWGAYALAAGVALVRGVDPPLDWFNLDLEREILQTMVEEGPLVDGVAGQRSVSVDGLPFNEYAKPLQRIAAIVKG